MAELELHIALAHIIRSYKVEYQEKEPLDYVLKGVLKPEKKLDLAFKKI